MDLGRIKFNIILYRLKLIKYHYVSLKLKRQHAMNYIPIYCNYCNTILRSVSCSCSIYLCIDCKLKLSFIRLWNWNYKFDNNNLKKKIFIYLLSTKFNICDNIIHLFITNM